MGALSSALDQVTAGIKSGLVGLVDDVESHPGRFTDDELGRLVRKNQCVRVAIEQTPGISVAGNGRKEFVVLFAAFIITADKKGSDRHQAALDITEKVAEILPFNRWSNEPEFMAVEPSTIAAENLYSGTIEKQGIALWAVSWTQKIRTIN